jgi:hypothetical protein
VIHAQRRSSALSCPLRPVVSRQWSRILAVRFQLSAFPLFPRSPRFHLALPNSSFSVWLSGLWSFGFALGSLPESVKSEN